MNSEEVDLKGRTQEIRQKIEDGKFAIQNNVSRGNAIASLLKEKSTGRIKGICVHLFFNNS